MSNVERLEKAKILQSNVKKQLTRDQVRAIESLTKEELKAIISSKNKLEDEFPIEGKVAPPIQHHH